MQERLIELETKFSFQEDTLNELNDIIIKQQRQIESLSRELNTIRIHLDEVRVLQEASSAGSGKLQEKPPHY